MLPKRRQSHQGDKLCDVSTVPLVARWPVFLARGSDADGEPHYLVPRPKDQKTIDEADRGLLLHIGYIAREQQARCSRSWCINTSDHTCQWSEGLRRLIKCLWQRLPNTMGLEETGPRCITTCSYTSRKQLALWSRSVCINTPGPRSISRCGHFQTCGSMCGNISDHACQTFKGWARSPRQDASNNHPWSGPLSKSNGMVAIRLGQSSRSDTKDMIKLIPKYLGRPLQMRTFSWSPPLCYGQLPACTFGSCSDQRKDEQATSETFNR